MMRFIHCLFPNDFYLEQNKRRKAIFSHMQLGRCDKGMRRKEPKTRTNSSFAVSERNDNVDEGGNRKAFMIKVIRRNLGVRLYRNELHA